jgi:peptidoglycan/xylan/chitin deacetylase (PgdA/CDA1 family)
VRGGRKWIYRATAGLARAFYSGAASILVYHRIVDDQRPRIGSATFIEKTPALLRAQVEVLRARGYRIVPIDELLASVKNGARKLAALTFDDGYVDALTTVLPLLRQLDAPFTVYLTTGYMDRLCVPWQYLLEESARRSGGGQAEFARMAAQFWPLRAPQQKALAESMWGAAEVAGASDRLFLSWDQVRELARDPLVTIGAHTLTHPVLRSLPEAEAAAEIAQCRGVIERHVGSPVLHFAYPFGSATQVGTREFRLAREAGYVSAVTTRVANVFRGSDFHALPRLYGATAEELDIQLSGIVSAVRYGGRRIVSV